jgi:hypothetical protein
MRNPFQPKPVSDAEIRAFRRTGSGSARVAAAAAQQARRGKPKSLAAQSAAHKKAQRGKR